MNEYTVDSNLRDLMEKVIKENHEFDHLKNVKIACLRKEKEKHQGEKTVFADCTKVSDKFKAVFPCDFIITFYLDGLRMSPDIQYRLMYHELLHVGYDPAKGKCSIVPHDLEDFKAVIKRWGVGWQYK